MIAMNTKLGDQEDGDALIRRPHFVDRNQLNFFL